MLGPDKFKNVTNGVTFRRWLLQCNPGLAELITETLGGDAWLTNATLLRKIEAKVDDAAFVKRFYDIKYQNKVRLAEYIERTLNIPINPNSLFSIQVKRIHEYKRQLMNAFGCIHRYLTLKKMSPAERKKVVPRVEIFAGKAAPGYYIAKLIIRLVNASAFHCLECAAVC
ncbi:Non-essential glycogen phosphorylase [Cystobasidiomycetes sp. EMM_F5]